MCCVRWLRAGLAANFALADETPPRLTPPHLVRRSTASIHSVLRWLFTPPLVADHREMKRHSWRRKNAVRSGQTLKKMCHVTPNLTLKEPTDTLMPQETSQALPCMLLPIGKPLSKEEDLLLMASTSFSPSLHAMSMHHALARQGLVQPLVPLVQPAALKQMQTSRGPRRVCGPKGWPEDVLYLASNDMSLSSAQDKRMVRPGASARIPGIEIRSITDPAHPAYGQVLTPTSRVVAQQPAGFRGLSYRH